MPIVRRTCPASRPAVDRRRRRTGTPQGAAADRDGREPVRQTETPRRAVAARFRRLCPRTCPADRPAANLSEPLPPHCALMRTYAHISGQREKEKEIQNSRKLPEPETRTRARARAHARGGGFVSVSAISLLGFVRSPQGTAARLSGRPSGGRSGRKPEREKRDTGRGERARGVTGCGG